MDPETGDAGGITLLTSNASADNDPAYSPDGRKIAFESFRSGSSASEAYTMNADGTSVRRLTFRAQEEFQPSWSPDGTNIVFQAGAGADFDILKVKSDGSDMSGALLTVDPANDGRPDYSKDGTKIVIDSNRLGAGRDDIFLMDPNLGDTAPLVNLTPGTPSQERHANFSPDGRKIVFHSNRDTVTGQPNNLEIYTMNSDGSGVTRLTSNATDDPGTTPANEAEDSDPIWSPDGRRILFQSRRAGGDVEVFTMNVDGGGVKRLTNNPGFDGRCDWQPVRPAAAPPTYYDVPKPPGAGKHKTSLTLKAKPRRDRRPPFRFTFSGRVRIPAGVSKAAVCSGRVRLVLKKGSRTVARGTARVSKGCTYKKRITIKSTKRTGRKKARLRVTARFGGNARLSASSRSTTVRIF